MTAEGHDHDLDAAEYYSCSILEADQIGTRTLQLSGKQLIEDQVEAQSTRQDQEDVFLLWRNYLENYVYYVYVFWN